MLSTTKAAIKAVLATDTTVDEALAKRIVRVCEGKEDYGVVVDDRPLDRPLKYEQVAKLLNVTKRRVGQLCDEGSLLRMTPVGRQSAIGISEKSVRAYLNVSTRGQAAHA